MKKRHLVTAIALLYPCISLAELSPYIGLDLGTHFFISTNRISVPNISGSIKRHDGIDGVTFGLYAGDGWYYCDKYYFGGEIFGKYNWANARLSNTLAGPPFVTSLKQRLRYSAGLRFIPGYFVDPNVMFFGVLGYEQTQFRTSASDGVIEGLTGTHTFNFRGWQVGLGIDVFRTRNCSIRLLDTYTFYNSKSMTTYSSELQLPVHVKMHPTGNEIAVGFTMHF